jgi:hypothetical protein
VVVGLEAQHQEAAVRAVIVTHIYQKHLVEQDQAKLL